MVRTGASRDTASFAQLKLRPTPILNLLLMAQMLREALAFETYGQTPIFFQPGGAAPSADGVGQLAKSVIAGMIPHTPARYLHK
jgi:hypothetical protein